jgi:hypothetical protein
MDEIGIELLSLKHDHAAFDCGKIALNIFLRKRAASNIERGVVYLNPGSAGPRRFKLPISLPRMTVGRGDDAKHTTVEVRTEHLFAFGAGRQRIAVELMLLG